jgi:type III pantothenate kinase
MLLVIDIGNTNIVMGVYRDDSLVKSWRLRTERNTTEDEFSVVVAGLFASGRIAFADIERTVISSVVPPLVSILDSFCRRYMGHAPHWVDARSYKKIKIHLPNPLEVGADRIVNAVAAYRRFGNSLIIIDFGTATTFDVVSAQGDYLGGAISPGIMISADALFLKASKLPRVEMLTPPENVVGKTTIDSIKSGLIYGYASMVDGMIERLKQELDDDPTVVATGGFAPLIAEVAHTIDAVDLDLTLEGLRIISADLVDSDA